MKDAVIRSFRLEGAVWRAVLFCVRFDQHTAKLRLFLLVPEARGRCLGPRLLEICMGYVRVRGYRGMQLSPHDSHRAACARYARNGWRLVFSCPVRSCGCGLVEQSWEIAFH
ncbi:hypothetical protein RA2_01301 [Roseovarius sp. A-2]|uniref:hypothetical protein n=1 Tax=Roseovarius sp. A-2 TaxID=1570360 RepID=UPI0009B5905F|nr:hypothetical protein [Roseovarius sp. A-2]GAW34256.1 hypothetical protein RA2_01301 [Roseovarius sp. A-2]